MIPHAVSAIELVAPHCDLVERLKAVPPSAKIRGIYLRSIEEAVERAGKTDPYRRHFPSDSWSSMRAYPLGEYLVRLALGGALVASPEKVHEGMREVSRGNSLAFAQSLLGRTMIRLLARDPVRLTEQALAGRRQTALYGRWELVRHGPQCIEMTYHEEYIWIESAIAGAALGTFEACGLSPTLETRLQDRFSGSTVIRW